MPFGFYEDVWITSWNQLMVDAIAFKGPVTLPPYDDMRAVFAKRPYALKDPRFSFTYPYWKGFLGQPSVCLVLFRDPVSFIESAQRLKADFNEIIGDTNRLMESWLWTHDAILNNDDGTFYYFHYSSVISGNALPFLEDLLGYAISRDFIQPKLCHIDEQACPPECQEFYDELRRRADRSVS